MTISKTCVATRPKALYITQGRSRLHRATAGFRSPNMASTIPTDYQLDLTVKLRNRIGTETSASVVRRRLSVAMEKPSTSPTRTRNRNGTKSTDNSPSLVPRNSSSNTSRTKSPTAQSTLHPLIRPQPRKPQSDPYPSSSQNIEITSRPRSSTAVTPCPSLTRTVASPSQNKTSSTPFSAN